MNEVAFVATKEPGWKRLVFLCDKADASASRLQEEELTEFVKLYRSSAADLAQVRTQSSNAELIEFLNVVVGRAYGILYRKPKRSIGEGLRGALSLGAQTVRRRKAFVFASALVVLCGIAFSASLLASRPHLRSYVVSEQEEPLFAKWREGKFEERSFDEMMMMQGFYSSNNPRVAIIAGSISASTFGVGTFYLLWTTGVQLGALGSDMAGVGKLGFFIGSICPHGSTELTGAVISGAAGLCLGWALIAPGRKSRGEALRDAGKDAFVLLVMAIIMMFLAAPVEGYFSFNPRVPMPVKVVFGCLAFGGWLLYWSGYAKDAAPLAETQGTTALP